METIYEYIQVDREFIVSALEERKENSHKGTYGHALLISGSTGMMGAAVLACGAALKSGCGLVTAHVPYQERSIIHISHPSAIVDCDPAPVFSKAPSDLARYQAIGIGPGLGQAQESISALKTLLENAKRGSIKTVLDADALNIIASHPEMFRLIPSGAVLTPHMGELERLVKCHIPDIRSWGYPWTDNMEILETVTNMADTLDSVIVVKGHRTLVCCPGKRLMINTTGNPGMAKGGSGDILTGLLTGLCARGYSPETAAALAVWFHGAAGDEAAKEKGQESMNSSDILSRICIC